MWYLEVIFFFFLKNKVGQNFISLHPKGIVSKEFCKLSYHAFLFFP